MGGSCAVGRCDIGVVPDTTPGNETGGGDIRFSGKSCGKVIRLSVVTNAGIPTNPVVNVGGSFGVALRENISWIPGRPWGRKNHQ